MTGECRSAGVGGILAWKQEATAALVAALLAAGLAPAAAEVVTVTAMRDNTLFQDGTGSLSNGAGPAVFSGRNSQNLARRALIRFDVAASVPGGAVISDAVLALNVSNVSDPAPRLFTLHRVQADWGEGASAGTGGGGAPATIGDATWLHTFWPDSPWSNAGGDFTSAVSGTQTVGDVGRYTWTGPLLAADVQAWLEDPTANFGWILVGDETAPNTARRFDSHENTEVASRPSLEITYVVPTAVPLPAGEGAEFLARCHPNPGTLPVRFEITLAAIGHAKLIVSDVTGRRVVTIVDRRLEAGRHEAVWDGRGLDGRGIPAGVYFYGLIVDGRAQATRRWVVLR